MDYLELAWSKVEVYLAMQINNQVYLVVITNHLVCLAEIKSRLALYQAEVFLIVKTKTQLRLVICLIQNQKLLKEEVFLEMLQQEHFLVDSIKNRESHSLLRNRQFLVKTLEKRQKIKIMMRMMVKAILKAQMNLLQLFYRIFKPKQAHSQRFLNVIFKGLKYVFLLTKRKIAV